MATIDCKEIRVLQDLVEAEEILSSLQYNSVKIQTGGFLKGNVYKHSALIDKKPDGIGKCKTRFVFRVSPELNEEFIKIIETHVKNLNCLEILEVWGRS